MYAQNQAINIKVSIEENSSTEIELPKVFLEAKDKSSIAYTSSAFKTENCNFNSETNRLILYSENIGKDIFIEIVGGVLAGTKLNINLAIGENSLISSKTYEILEGYINKIGTETKLGDFIKNTTVINETEITVLDKNNQKIEEIDIIGTGMSLVLKSENETKTFKLVVNGDTTGDGLADFKDIVSMNNHKLNKKKLNEVELIAGDVNNDNKVDFKDIVKVNKYRLNKITQLFEKS